MPRSLRNEFQIRRLALDLRLDPASDPVAAIRAYCRKRIDGFLREIRCTTLSDLLAIAQDRLGTFFIELRTEGDLVRVRQEYVDRGELGFARIAEELSANVYAITFQLLKPRSGERPFVSVIDCRGEKGRREYFSKWHELAHLLTLTNQARLKFCRTHLPCEEQDPEERLMEVVAGDCAFFSDLVVPHAPGTISFDAIRLVHQQLCPEASKQASLIGIVQAWPRAVILVRAEMAFRRDELRGLAQQCFEFRSAPPAQLRAVQVTVNEAAQRIGLMIPTNMRVPERSVIKRTFLEGHGLVEDDEDLSWWTTSKGERLTAHPVHVAARTERDHVHALITPRD